MLTKKQSKKTATKKITNQQKTTKTSRLRTWLFDGPAIFMLLTILADFIVVVTYAFISGIFSLPLWPLKPLLFLTLCGTTYFLIKKLPHNNMYRDDFVAITNGCSLITILLFVGLPLLVMSIFGDNLTSIYYVLTVLYVTHPAMFLTTGAILAMLICYFLGLTISGIYAKYKRAVELGISKWKVILSMPFGFLLTWLPGYLLPPTKNESNLEIKSKWFAKFNKWTVSNKSNTLFVFLVLLLLRNTFSDGKTLLLVVFLLMIYTLWIIKHKKSFIKNINRGYAWTAVGINIALVIFSMFLYITAGKNNTNMEISVQDIHPIEITTKHKNIG